VGGRRAKTAVGALHRRSWRRRAGRCAGVARSTWVSLAGRGRPSLGRPFWTGIRRSCAARPCRRRLRHLAAGVTGQLHRPQQRRRRSGVGRGRLAPSSWPARPRPGRWCLERSSSGSGVSQSPRSCEGRSTRRVLPTNVASSRRPPARARAGPRRRVRSSPARSLVCGLCFRLAPVSRRCPRVELLLLQDSHRGECLCSYSAPNPSTCSSVATSPRSLRRGEAEFSAVCAAGSRRRPLPVGAGHDD